MLTENQALFLQEKFKMTICKIENGKVFHLNTNIEIPVEHIGYQKIKDDGFYYLSEATCDNAIHKNIEDTKENRIKHGCQVGSPLKGCSGYTKNKCAVYFLETLEKRSVSLDAKTLIDVFEIE